MLAAGTDYGRTVALIALSCVSCRRLRSASFCEEVLREQDKERRDRCEQGRWVVRLFVESGAFTSRPADGEHSHRCAGAFEPAKLDQQFACDRRLVTFFLEWNWIGLVAASSRDS